MDDKWICSNCGAENTLKFCTKCGTPKPEAEAAAAETVQPASGLWDCVCGNTGNTGNFCKKCGRSREEGTVIPVAAAAAAAEIVEEAIPEAEILEAEVPGVEVPEAEIPEAEAPEIELTEPETIEEVIPEEEIPETEIPEVELPEAEVPEIEVPEMEAPEEIVPEIEIPEMEVPEMEFPEMEIPEAEVSELELPEEAEMPEVEIPEAAAPVIELAAAAEAAQPATGLWDCVCGKTGNTGNFCRDCGRPREQGAVTPVVAAAAAVPELVIPETQPPEAGQPEQTGPELTIPEEPQGKTMEIPADGTWTCSCGQTGNTGAFCRNCGTPREQGAAGTAAPVIPQEETPAKGKKKTFKPLIIIIAAAVVVIAAAVVALVFLLPKKYTVNQYVAEGELPVQEGFDALADQEQDISFLYPDYLLADRALEGDYIYAGSKDEYPYILITRVNEKTTPKDFFKAYKQDMLSQYPGLELSEIYEVPVEGKSLYMMRTHLPDVDIDQEVYLEPYENYYILYRSKGYPSGEDNRELYYAISSLRPSAAAYPVPQVSQIVNDIGNFSVEVPDDYEITEFNTGLYAAKNNTGLFAAYFNNDIVGTIIYDREDFLDRADRIDAYLEQLLGVQEVTVSQGTTSEINGRDYFVYPITVVLNNGEAAAGKLAVGECDSNVGVYLVCYYLQEKTGSIQEEEAEQFLQSMTVYGDPNSTFYQVEYVEDAGFGKFACDSSLLGDVVQTDKTVEIISPDGKQKIIMEKLEGPEVYNAAERIAQSLADQYKESYLLQLDDPEDGRYYYHAMEITYETDKAEKHVYRLYGIETKDGNVYCMHYDVLEGEDTWAEDVVYDIIWSWKLTS